MALDIVENIKTAGAEIIDEATRPLAKKEKVEPEKPLLNEKKIAEVADKVALSNDLKKFS